MTFFGRLLFVIGVSLAATLVVLPGAAFLAGDRVGQEIEQARVSHLLGTLRQTTEANLAIGLSLDEVTLLQSLIERERAQDHGIVVIDVFNTAGRSVYSTDSGSLGDSVDPSWVQRLSSDGIWHTVLRGETVFGTRFDNDLGVAGGIAVTVSGATRAARAEAMGLDLSLRALAVGGCALLLGLALAYCGAWYLGRPFLRVAAILRAGEGAAPAPPRHREGLARLAVQTRESWREADSRIARGLAHLEALDDAE